MDEGLLAFVAEFCGVDKGALAPSSRLQEDLGVIGGDAVDLMHEYARRFRVDMTGFEIGEYFDNDLTVDLYAFFAAIRRILAGPLGASLPKPKHRRALTLRDLSEAAKRGKWLQH